MPDIPKSNPGLLDHVNASAPLSNHQLRYYGGNGTAEALGNFRRGLDGAVSAAAREYQRSTTAIADFKKKQEDTENRLSAAEARNAWAKIDGELTNRMAKNPAAYDKFKEWAKEADNNVAEVIKPFLDKMTPDFRKEFELELAGRRQAAFTNHVHTGILAKVSAEYTRFQNLFKDYAVNNYDAAIKLLDDHRGVLINENEYRTKRDIDLPKIFQSAQARRDIDANKEDIISVLEQVDDKGNHVNYPNITPEHRNTLLRYAKAKDAQRRADENTAIYEGLSMGATITKEDIEWVFEGKTSAEDLRQKQEQIQMVERFESARERAKTAAEQKHFDTKLNNALYELMTMEFPANEDEAKKLLADKTRQIFNDYAGNGNAVSRLKTQLDETYKATRKQSQGKDVVSVSYKNTPEYQAAIAEISELKKRGKLAADKPGWGDDESAGTATYIEKMLTIDVDNYIKKNPNVQMHELSKYLTEQVEFYNKSTVEEIAKNYFVVKKTTEGKTGTFSGKKVVLKNGKWQYAK